LHHSTRGEKDRNGRRDAPLCKFATPNRSPGSISDENEGGPISKKEDIARQRKQVAEALKLLPGDVDKQMEFSGLKKSTFYKRRKEVKRAA
jgi:hypothetical protein